MAAKVLVCQEVGRFNMTTAREFGELVFLVPEGVSPFSTDEIVCSVKASLSEQGYDPLVDYLALSGNLAVVAISTATVARFARSEQIKVLIFNSRADSFQARILHIPGLVAVTGSGA